MSCKRPMGCLRPLKNFSSAIHTHTQLYRHMWVLRFFIPWDAGGRHPQLEDFHPLTLGQDDLLTGGVLMHGSQRALDQDNNLLRKSVTSVDLHSFSMGPVLPGPEYTHSSHPLSSVQDQSNTWTPFILLPYMSLPFISKKYFPVIFSSSHSLVENKQPNKRNSLHCCFFK